MQMDMAGSTGQQLRRRVALQVRHETAVALDLALIFKGKSMKLEVIGWSHVKIGQDHYRW
jgi:hypothetical protein